MTADTSNELQRLRAGIQDMLQKVPPSVCAGGLKQTRAYKDAAEKAKKVLASSRATLAAAQAAYTNLSSFWG